MAIIEGTCREEFRAVREVLEYHLDSGIDVGASVAVFIDGEPVVDLWGGYFDATYTRPWERDTIVQTFSTTKTMTALVALLLADNGVLDLDAPVVKYWPEFGAEGKSEILVRQILGYTSGVAGFSQPVSLYDTYDHEKSTAMLARHGNARGIAAAQSVLANGGAYGKRLLSNAGWEQVLRTQADGVDLVLGTPMRWGMGYALSSPTEMNFAPRSAYWAGNGGSLSYVDLEARMSVGFAMNRWVRGEHENDRSFRIMAAVYEGLEAK
jgi:CubicO group peptidase (beta-lactamase class C family)